MNRFHKMRGKQPIKGSTILVVAVGFASLTGCAGWRGVRDVRVEEPPARFLQAEEETIRFSDDPWWESLEDKSLNAFMEEAFSSNLSLEQAVSRYDQSRALLTTARSTWFPTLSASASYTESGDFKDGESTSSSPGFSSSTSALALSTAAYSTGVTAAYELDLWGKLHAGRQAAYADFRASRESLEALTLSLTGQVARSYYSVIALREQESLLERTVDAYQDSHDLLRSRYKRGVATSLDVYQGETSLAGARSQLATVRSSLAAAENSFATLFGKYPRAGLIATNAALPSQLDPLGPGLPSDLVQRRPDVRSAWWNLVAADRRAAEAVAQQLPSFSLTGTITGSGDELSEAVDPDNLLWRAIGNLTLPLFEGGRRRANAARAEAAWRGQVAAYKESLITAFRDVENALAQERNQRDAVEQLEAQVRAAEASLRLASDRYMQGVSDYLPVTVAQTTYLNARRGLITARQNLVGARISLALALGGDWTGKQVNTLLSENQMTDEE